MESDCGGREIRALIVDDSAVMRMIHEDMLGTVGVKKKEVAQNGKEAIDIILHNSPKTFDLILMDLDMPIMNGIEATRALRSMGVQSKIAGVSGRSSVEAQEFMDAGLDYYQQKPLTIAKLSQIIHDIHQFHI
ncbi:two-component response regulator ARR22-like [Senna tora]|uniref:Two-component response regulator ARR22-like n=1 Tax=Senna tora TaxID=362788 RepID=A0A834SVZ8_9FABA|nr:two-component response regulator ARR22-like [Senna tora]